MTGRKLRRRWFGANSRPTAGQRDRAGSTSHHFHYRRLRLEPLEDRLLLAADFGDAPNPYPTLLVSNGARHEATGPRLGALIDTELDGQAFAGATGDDMAGVDDEDGVTFGALHVGQTNATVTVNVQNAPQGAKLDAWIDFNADGSWDGAHEQIAMSNLVQSGSNLIIFSVPLDVSPGEKYARFRLSSAGSSSPSGPAADGEVEDVAVNILPPAVTSGIFGHERVTIPQHNDATTVTSADLDADGDVDLISSSRGGAILWSVNDGQGNFTTQTLATGAGTTWKIRTADVDRDGDLDIISAGENAHAVSWRENTAPGIFQTHTVTTTAITAYDVWASDLDGDGDVDLLAAGENGFAWYENDGTQHFTMRTMDGAAFNVSAVRAVDLDRDGDMDIVIGQYGSPALSWYENNGSENFTRHLIVPASNLSIGDAQVGDVDGDGDFDIVAGFTGETTSRVRWYRNNGAGTFQENAVSTHSNRVQSVELVDLDGDADLLIPAPQMPRS